MELEKEIRFAVNDKMWQKALSCTMDFKPKVSMTDITMGAFGRDSVAKTGKVFRVRQKPDKVTIEIKNKIEDGWQEEAIQIDSVDKGVSFFTLAGLKPYLYIARTREVKKFKNLKIFFDDVELLGKYIEIEYQDSVDAQNEIKEFCSMCGINGVEQPMYGTIINQKYETDNVFRLAFEQRLSDLIKNI